MKSPFPGMDPFLEAHWGDVHTSLVTYARDQLRGQIPEDLRVRVEEQVAVEAPDGNGAAFYPDVRVLETAGPAPPSGAKAAGTAVADPLILPYEIEPPTLRSIRITDVRSGNRVVTAIELLSRANKLGEKRRQQYIQKQEELLGGGVNLVEVDLLRAGRYVLAAPEEDLPPEYRKPYRICVTRLQPPRREVYRVTLRERLPIIRVPLRPRDPDALLDMQALVDASYEAGGYDDIDYRVEPAPALEGDDATWADALLRQAGKR
ncbi:MAG: DUF4058 family protein [Planctomycetes bacterium]|nr:DUF4058 family protein [Planctomycetota bacterium]